MSIEELKRRVAARENDRISRIGQEAAIRYLRSKERKDPLESTIKFLVGLVYTYVCLMIVAVIIGTIL